MHSAFYNNVNIMYIEPEVKKNCNTFDHVLSCYMLARFYTHVTTIRAAL